MAHIQATTPAEESPEGSISQSKEYPEKMADLEHDVEKTPTLGLGTTQVLETDLDRAGYHRQLGRRQIMMMTFGAGIGTGLWVGTGSALHYAGPGGVAVVYSIVAYLVYTQYMSVGEMSAYKPIHGGFIRQASEYVDPALGFAVGINFWFSWVMIIPAEITAAISVLNFWPSARDFPIAAYISIIFVGCALVNVFPVRFYGRIEYCMSFVKIIAIFAMIFFMFIMTSGGIKATHGPIEFRYWKHPGAFRNGAKGIGKAFIQAGFSFGGGEHIAVIAGEAKNPRRTIKKTIGPVFWRMVTFFVVNVWLVGMCVNPDDERLVSASGTLRSPFVIAIQDAGVPWLAHVLNVFIFIAVVSCNITSFYVASRSLTALADINLIPKFFGRKDSRGRPYVSLIICSVLGGGLTYLNCNSSSAVVYNWFSSLVGIAALFQWASLYISHIRFRRGLKAQGIDYRRLPFRNWGAPIPQYIGLLICALFLGFEFYLAVWPFGAKSSAKNFFATFLACPLFFFDYFVYKLVRKTKIVKAAEMDFSTARPFDDEDERRALEKARGGEEKEKISMFQHLKNLVFG
ncbi:hypothetical protein L228DRAFT_266251 [Xylona heveae TC161]|uniref:Amino acid permease/ SLC12A domain-containing protein n=1 Tax=Xylona heveae (strain CBS 132557 / TC161) TaxID=1328760 RepID=A0A165J6J3_XYLHT|nr:hypothetical protein L228DRAFT_266251 [Xylona heveae TC161]KZF25802.1 hypothetical protein L228DRAFT_266251 [Xylona heveae TC161]